MTTLELHGVWMQDICEEIEPSFFFELVELWDGEATELRKVWYCTKCGVWKKDHKEYKGEKPPRKEEE